MKLLLLILHHRKQPLVTDMTIHGSRVTACYLKPPTTSDLDITITCSDESQRMMEQLFRKAGHLKETHPVPGYNKVHMVLYIDEIHVDLCCSILIGATIEAPTTYHTVRLPLINSGKLVPHTRIEETEKEILCSPKHLIDQSDQSGILSFNRTKGYLLWFLYTIHFRRRFDPSSHPHHLNLINVKFRI